MRWIFILSLIALLGSGLLQFFTILCGASTGSVLGKWYWLQADTSGIPGANSITRWTSYTSCGVNNGRNFDCSSSQAAYPMSPVANFGTTDGVPDGLQSKHGSTYYLSKTGWAFLLIGLFFTVLTIVPTIVSMFSKSTKFKGISSIASLLAMLFMILSASLLTAAYVKARNAFRSAGSSTKLGSTMFGFLWASVVLLFLSTILSATGCFAGRRKNRQAIIDDESSHDTFGNSYAQEKQSTGFFSRKKPVNDAETLNSRVDYHPKDNLPLTNTDSEVGQREYNLSKNRQLAGSGAVGAAGAGIAAAAIVHSNAYDKTPDQNNAEKKPVDYNYTENMPIAKDSNFKNPGLEDSKVSDLNAQELSVNKEVVNSETGNYGTNYQNSSGKTQVPQSDSFNFKPKETEYPKTASKDVNMSTAKQHDDSFFNSEITPNESTRDFEANKSNHDENDSKGIWATAAAAFGFGSAAEASKNTKSEINTTAPDEYGKYLNKDEYGNETVGYKTGVDNNAAATAANSAIGSHTKNDYLANPIDQSGSYGSSTAKKVKKEADNNKPVGAANSSKDNSTYKTVGTNDSKNIDYNNDPGDYNSKTNPKVSSPSKDFRLGKQELARSESLKHKDLTSQVKEAKQRAEDKYIDVRDYKEPSSPIQTMSGTNDNNYIADSKSSEFNLNKESKQSENDSEIKKGIEKVIESAKSVL